ncbi:hypothetical protein VVR46_09200, partial [Corynebacterium phoceense]|uniref:hypothetical protein n=1 Tax=Corynebacterium phoceense TaxID=1686286 RepID=UPI0034CEB032
MWFAGRRLDRVNAFPTKAEMDTYLRETATVALQKVAMQMRARGYQVLLLTSELPELGLPQLDLQLDSNTSATSATSSSPSSLSAPTSTRLPMPPRPTST